MGVKAIIVPDIDGDPGREPGAVEFRPYHLKPDQIAGIGFRCPCGCGSEGYLPIRMEGFPRTQTPEWEWDGNREKPTLHPSVFNKGLPCKWHGWLRNGEWVTV